MFNLDEQKKIHYICIILAYLTFIGLLIILFAIILFIMHGFNYANISTLCIGVLFMSIGWKFFNVKLDKYRNEVDYILMTPKEYAIEYKKYLDNI